MKGPFSTCCFKCIPPRGTIDSSLCYCGTCRTGQGLHREGYPIAVQYERNELVKLFLDHAADVNTPANYDCSPLFYAADNYDPAVHDACRGQYDSQQKHIKILLSFGADVCVEDYRGKTPFALIRDKHISNPKIRPMLRALAMKKSCLRPSIELKDETIIEKDPKQWTYYQDCLEQIRTMKSTTFVESFTFFELLTKCQCQIAPLMRNPEFARGFERYDLEVFSAYAEDILEAFRRAQRYRHSMLEQVDVINEAVYCILPHVVVRNVIRYIFNNVKFAN